MIRIPPQSALIDFIQKSHSEYYGKICEIRGVIEGWLSYIPHSFPHYTRHTIAHSDQIVYQMSCLLFADGDHSKPVVNLSGTEAYILVAAAYLHDAGMVTSDQEKEEILKSPNWDNWTTGDGGGAKRWNEIIAMKADATSIPDSATRNFLADVQTRFLIAEFISSVHHIRAGNVIEVHHDQLGHLDFGDHILRKSIAEVCIAHGLRHHELNDKERFPELRDIGTDKVNLRFLAIMLRLGDLLDMSVDRACPLLLNAASPLPADRLAHLAFASIDMFLDRNGNIDLEMAKQSGSLKFAKSVDVVRCRNGDIIRKITLHDPISAIRSIAEYAGWKHWQRVENSEIIEKLASGYTWWLEDHPTADANERRAVIEEFADTAGISRFLLKERLDPERTLPQKPFLGRYRKQSFRRERFVLEMANPENRYATDATQKAGYNKASAQQCASLNLKEPDIVEAIEREKSSALGASGVTRSQAIGRLTQIAFGSLDLFYDETGDLDWRKAMEAGVFLIVRSSTEVTRANCDVFRSIQLHDSARAASELLDFGEPPLPRPDDQDSIEKCAFEFIDWVDRNPGITQTEWFMWLNRFAIAKNLPPSELEMFVRSLHPMSLNVR